MLLAWGTRGGFARVKQLHTMPSFGIAQWGRIWGLSGPFQPSRWYLSHLPLGASWGRLQEVGQTGLDPAQALCGAEQSLASK